MPISKLDSPQNPTIKATAKLRTSRGRQQSGQIIIDGEREISRAAQCGVLIDTIFVPESSESAPWESLARNVYVVSDRAHEKIAFGNRLEPVAVARRPDTSLESLNRRMTWPRDAVFIVLEAVEKPGNIGAILRSADGAGVAAVLLVDPITDIFNPNAIRASIGTVFSVPVATLSFAEYQAWGHNTGVSSLLAVCDSTAIDYARLDYRGRNAIILGNEATGLSNRWGCLGGARKIALPMRGIADSLNVSAAATVLMYEATKLRGCDESLTDQEE